MRGAQKIGWLPVLFALLATLTFWLPSGHAQDGKKAKPPEGLAEVSPAMPMPAFSLPDLNGNAFNSSALQGQVAVMRFWASW